MRHSSEHTSSYYAATRHQAEYPSLQGEHHFDVAVVGGGFTGTSAALHLAERGYSVALIEANRIGWGATGRNGGQLIDGFVDIERIEKRFGRDAADMAWNMGLECREIVIDRVRRYNIDCDLKFGFLDLAMKPSEMTDFEEWMEEKNSVANRMKCGWFRQSRFGIWSGLRITSAVW